MTRGEMFALMSCGMAGVAGTVMAIYATILGPVIPNALAAILVASVISTPAALAVAALMVPFTPTTDTEAIAFDREPAAGPLDAITRGTADGVGPLVGIASTLLVTVALVTLVNMVLGKLPFAPPGSVTLQGIAALFFRPVVWLIGIPWSETASAAMLMGTKTVLNELVAYVSLSKLPPTALSPASRNIITYALCGFANFGSLGIMVGGIGAMVPARRAEITALGAKSMISGTIATCLSGALAGLLAPR
jgi:CNT family concentrative nucleoside transporter